MGTGANDSEFTEGKTPVWTFDYGDVNLLVFVGYCKISLSGKVYDDMANEYFDENSEFFKNHHVAISWMTKGIGCTKSSTEVVRKGRLTRS